MKRSPRDDAFQPTTTELLAAAVSGQRTAVGSLILRLEPYLRTCVHRYLGERRFRDEGEDLLQVIRLAIVRGLPGLRSLERRPFKAWLRQVIRSRLLVWSRGQRARRRRPEAPVVNFGTANGEDVPSEVATPSEVVRGREEIELVRKAIERVPAQYREVLRFVFETEPSNEELAAFLDRSPDAARKFVARGLAHLKEVLARYQSEEE